MSAPVMGITVGRGDKTKLRKPKKGKLPKGIGLCPGCDEPRSTSFFGFRKKICMECDVELMLEGRRARFLSRRVRFEQETR